MNSKSGKIYGNYLGWVVNHTPDPSGRMRVQVFIPHLTNTLYEGWNKNLTNKFFRNPNELGSNTLKTLQQNLPWAECAMPIFGGATAMKANATTGIVNVNGGRSFEYSPDIVAGMAGAGVTVPANAVGPATEQIADMPDQTNDSSGDLPSADEDLPPVVPPVVPPVASPVNEAAEDPQAYMGLDRNTTGTGGTDINNNLTSSNGIKALLAAIGKGESGFSVTEANKNTYNQVSNNANVRREYNSNGNNLAAAQAAYGDYGFFQNNDATEGSKVYSYLKGQGFSDSQASYYRAAITNGQGKGSYSLQDQSQAMVYYLTAQYPSAVSKLNSLNSSSSDFASQVKSIAYEANMDGKWFGLDEGLAAGAANVGSTQFAAISEGGLVQVAADSQIPEDPTDMVQVNVAGNQGSQPDTTIAGNGSPNGFFSVPAYGAKVWVFFYDGDVQRPVYFAAAVEPSAGQTS